MRNFTLSKAVMAALLSLAIVIVSCDSNSSEVVEDVLDNSTATRMELSLSGDYAQFMPSVGFSAYDMKGKAKTMQTSDGTEVTELIWIKNYDETPFSSASVQIKGTYSSFEGYVTLYNLYNLEGKVTVTATVYKNDKVIKTDSITLELTSDKTSVSSIYSYEEGFEQIL